MLALIGWLALLAPLVCVTIWAFFVTFDTFSEALFSGKWYHKLAGAIIWIVVIGLWIKWLSLIEINI